MVGFGDFFIGVEIYLGYLCIIMIWLCFVNFLTQ